MEPIVPNPNTNDDEMPSSSSSQWIYETVNGCHVFKIKGYSLAKGIGVGKSMTSGKFSVGGHDWVILFYPDGSTQVSHEYVSVFLKLVSPGEIRSTFEFKLLDQTGKGKHYVHKISEGSPRTFKPQIEWGFPQCMNKSELETSSYVKDDCLSIHCTVRVVKTSVEEEKHYVIPIPPSDIGQNLKDLLESEIGSDITIRVGNELFRAHKSILAARSPVFKAMFFGQVGKPGMETVAIEEFDPFAFKAMLLFLYSDELPEAHELSDHSDYLCTFLFKKRKEDSLCTSTTLMHHLLVAADRFDLARLKLMCESKLYEDITANTVATTLVLADKLQCLQLKNDCLNFAAKTENVGEVMKSDGFAHLEKNYPSLLVDLLKTGAVVNGN
ncbi:hypothetical protein MKX01_009544 [Papaver californicum]|nr:hypothetical protein MKX01_009544 [Papaver californicum]